MSYNSPDCNLASFDMERAKLVPALNASGWIGPECQSFNACFRCASTQMRTHVDLIFASRSRIDVPRNIGQSARKRLRTHMRKCVHEGAV